jgi:WD40 repeat protein
MLLPPREGSSGILSRLSAARQVKYNPNRSGIIAVGHDDGFLHIWDHRNPKEPLLKIAAHSHWITQLHYNPFHDELLLTSSTDSLVNLWRVQSLSSKVNDAASLIDDPVTDSSVASTSTPLKKSGSTSSISSSYSATNIAGSSSLQTLVPDVRLERIDEHEDSVYACSWSSLNPWVFASVSVDGRLLVHAVPEQEKMRLLTSAH